jgi:hypothetical protein
MQVVAGESDIKQDEIVEPLKTAQLALGEPAPDDPPQLRKGKSAIPEIRPRESVVAHGITKLS